MTTDKEELYAFLAVVASTHRNAFPALEVSISIYPVPTILWTVDGNAASLWLFQSAKQLIQQKIMSHFGWHRVEGNVFQYSRIHYREELLPSDLSTSSSLKSDSQV
jgi:hypothetical protein